MNQLRRLIEESGFEGIGEFDTKELRVRKEVRAMCEVNKCDRYNTSWSCPPALESLEVYQEKLTSYTGGYVFQAIARMEDAFDYEAIKAAQDLYAERFDILQEKVKDFPGEIMLFAAGRCKLCEKCTYPDNPCVHPDRTFPSLEACGLIVSEVCQLAQVPYYHGPNTVAFIGAALYK